MGMTRKDAIEILEEVKTIDDSMFVYSQAYNDALDMAIEALKAQEPHWISVLAPGTRYHICEALRNRQVEKRHVREGVR